MIYLVSERINKLNDNKHPKLQLNGWRQKCSLVQIAHAEHSSCVTPNCYLSKTTAPNSANDVCLSGLMVNVCKWI